MIFGKKKPSKRDQRFNDFISYYRRLMTLLPEPLLEELANRSNRVSYNYQVHPIEDSADRDDKKLVAMFTVIDVLWWEKYYRNHKSTLIKSIEDIQAEINLFVLLIIEDNDSLKENEDIKSIYLGIKQSTLDGNEKFI